MKVVTLDSRKFFETGVALAGRVRDSGFIPDVILGVKTGGAHMLPAFGEVFPGTVMDTVSAKRPWTRMKGRMHGLLSKFPFWITDALRMAELRMIERGWITSNRIIDTSLEPLTTRLLADNAASRVLLVDDSLDSGLTLKLLVKQLRRQYPKAEIRTAVMTVTTRVHCMEADYTVYDDQTLLRFPWAADAKN